MTLFKKLINKILQTEKMVSFATTYASIKYTHAIVL